MPAQLQFRPLNTPLSKKLLQAFRKDVGWATTPQSSIPANPHGKVQWVTVESGKECIGIARLELAPPEFCHVADLIISSKHQRKGVGSWFLKHIEQYCGNFGVRRLVLEPHSGSEKFYAARAFNSDPLVPSMLRKELNPFQRKLFIPH